MFFALSFHRLGAAGVGKTCLIQQCVSGRFMVDYDPTIEGSFRTSKFTLDEAPCVLDIFDSVEPGNPDSMRDMSIEVGQGFILMYSITSRASLDEIGTYWDLVCRIKQKSKIAVCLVGAKCDLEVDRQVSVQEGQDYAKNFGAAFFETSAKTRLNIEAPFYELVREIKREGGWSPDAASSHGARCSIM
jgi:GTPase KRas